MELDARRMNMAFFGVVPYSCAGHLVPYAAAVKDLNPNVFISLEANSANEILAN